MPNVRTLLQRRRRRRANRQGLSPLARMGALLLTLLTIGLGVGAAAVGRLYLELTEQVPAVEDIQAFFEVGQAPGFRATEIVDREGELLFHLRHPAAAEAQWVGLDESAGVTAPEHLVQGLVVRQDPTFWQRTGPMSAGGWSRLLAGLLGRPAPTGGRTLEEQLVAATLLPVEDDGPRTLRQEFRLLLLTERLGERYDKPQLLTWYLNSADFGHFNYGVDAAALAYFGKHADGLTLGESAVLAALPGQADQILSSPTHVREAQRQVLEALVDRGEITERRARAARSQPLALDWDGLAASVERSAVGQYLLAELEGQLGPQVRRRGGLTVTTTLDADLQRQAECLIQTQLDRLSGGNPTGSAAAADGSPCLAAGLLAPLRPGQTGVDYGLTEGTVVILDPTEGQLLALAGSARGGRVADPLESRPLGGAVQPFLYLTAFSRGFSPGSMVLDLPQEAVLVPADGGGPRQYQGPVRMRTALVGGLEAAAERTVHLAGRENVLRTLAEFDLLPPTAVQGPEALARGRFERSALDLAAAYGTVANRGLSVGRGEGRLDPAAIRQVTDRFGRTVYTYEPATRVVLSEGLAYLLVDVLTGEAPGDGLAERRSALLADRPSGQVVAAADGVGAWAVGFTPGRVVSLWLGVADEEDPPSLPAEDGAVPVLAALLRYATRDMTATGWARPPQVVEVEVCDPSGLLPTEYCPKVVREVYLQGTEPTAYDNLYQPFTVNKDTGKLATLRTPLESVEERVYLVPPPEAGAWAEQAGIERPPTEYDPLPVEQSSSPQVMITSPSDFEVRRGAFVLRGNANPEGFAAYRLQYGSGLNPRRWTQIGEEREQQVSNGVLGRWETGELSGLFTLQLSVVLEDGSLLADSVTLTVDNRQPEARLLTPVEGDQVSRRLAADLTVEVGADDNVAVDSVVIYLDGERLARLTERPYVLTAPLPAAGEHALYAVVTDTAGNEARTEDVAFEVAP